MQDVRNLNEEVKNTKKEKQKFNGLYLIYSPLNFDKPDGIEKKILCQKELFVNNNIHMEFKVLEKKNGTFWNYDDSISSVDFIYFRRSTTIDWNFVSFFKKVKKKNKKIKIFMEIPTFPYEGEYDKSITSKFKLLVDELFRTKIKGLIDRIVVTGIYDGEYIFGIKAINIVNGIDLKKIKIKKFQEKFDDDIVISCIAKFSPWHGYERLIKGLYNYYINGGKYNFSLLMVGDGPEKKHYEELVDKLNLEEHVEFTGKVVGDDLNKIYNRTDIGCCSLGRYKSGINVIGDLKSREFLAKGIPIICGCEIDVLKGLNLPYVLYFDNNSSDIDYNKIIEFYKEITTEFTPLELTEKIRRDAEKLIDLENTFNPVIEEAKDLL